VFFEEKEISPDAFQFNYNPTATGQVWRTDDHPNIMHGNGANYGFADGHADFRQWVSTKVIDWIKKDGGATGLPSYADSKEDFRWMHNAVWGVEVTAP
jgi:prepilin-type processing-associated H-X9-DG protein